MVKHQPAQVRREQIFAAALKISAEKGYHATRIDDIAMRAGLSKGAVYHHFRSKEEIFFGLFDSFFDEIATVLRAVPEEAPAADGLRAFAVAAESMIGEDPTAMRGLIDFYLLSARHEKFRQRFADYYESLIRDTAGLIRRGIADGEMTGDRDPDKVARVLVTGGDGLIFIHLVLEQDHHAVDSFRELVELTIRALTTKEPS